MWCGGVLAYELVWKRRTRVVRSTLVSAFTALALKTSVFICAPCAPSRLPEPVASLTLLHALAGLGTIAGAICISIAHAESSARAYQVRLSPASSLSLHRSLSSRDLSSITFPLSSLSSSLEQPFRACYRDARTLTRMGPCAGLQLLRLHLSLCILHGRLHLCVSELLDPLSPSSVHSADPDDPP